MHKIIACLIPESITGGWHMEVFLMSPFLAWILTFFHVPFWVFCPLAASVSSLGSAELQVDFFHNVGLKYTVRIYISLQCWPGY